MAIDAQVKRLIIVFKDYLKEHPEGGQQSFAELVNLSQPTVSRMLNGQYPINQIMTDAVCLKLGYSASWFIKGEGDKKAKRDSNTLTEVQMLRAEIDILRAEVEKMKSDIVILSKGKQLVRV